MSKADNIGVDGNAQPRDGQSAEMNSVKENATELVTINGHLSQLPEQVRNKTLEPQVQAMSDAEKVTKEKTGNAVNGLLQMQAVNHETESSLKAACSNRDNDNKAIGEDHTEKDSHVSDTEDGSHAGDSEVEELDEEDETGDCDDVEGETDNDVEIDEIDEDTPNENDVEEDVPLNSLEEPPRGDELAGPDRSRRRQARQRRQQSGFGIVIGNDIYERWRQIGAEWGLNDDGDIARLLLQHHEDIQAGRPLRPPPAPRCRGCGERLVPRECEACGPHHHSIRLSSDRGGGGGGFGGGSGGGDRYCGRCRD